MRRSSPLLALLLVGLSLASARAEAPAPFPTSALSAEAQAIFDRFDHRVHAKILEKEHLGCTACHQVGGTGDPRLSAAKLDAAYLPPPEQACHYCHNPGAGERKIGPGRCALCHDHVEPPASHGADWVHRHGDEMLVGALQCETCHRPTFCIDCHNRKEPIFFQVHDRSWITVHGIAARTDPTTCGTCHLQSDCESCHATGAGRLP